MSVLMSKCGRRAGRQMPFACMKQTLCSLPTSSTLLQRLDNAIEENNTKVDELLAQYKNDIKKVKSKFDIFDKKRVGDVILRRKKPKKGETLEIKFNCDAEVMGFDDDDGYDRILYQLERAQEKNLDYNDKIALGDEKEGIEVDVYIQKGQQRLTFHCIASDKIVVQKVYFDSPLSLAGNSLELKKLYNGPKYVNLEEPLREALQYYLKTRLVDDFLSTFIFNYSRVKREKEFTHWAEHMKTIIS